MCFVAAFQLQQAQLLVILKTLCQHRHVEASAKGKNGANDGARLMARVGFNQE